MTRDHDACIVATACRFPDADSPDRFWENLAAGVCSIREAPEPRRHPDPAARHGAFLADVRGFDAAFFGMDDAEAAVTDPQQRILLEVGHEALERAGMAGPRRRGRKVAVFVGVGQSDYAEPLLRLLWSGAQLHPATAVGNLRNLIAARVAHAMDLDGPAIAVDTACSSSLVALHLAREALLRGECDLALACGVTLNLAPTSFAMLARAGALSPTGRCRPFAQGADGIALGEGVGAVVLERLADARGRGAPVHAVLRGSAVNNDGRTFTPMAPKPTGQVAVMRAAWEAAGLDPRSATFIEAHGTGTRVGDSVEARSVAAVMGRVSGDALRMGSVKGNVGHMLSAAGMPSVIKTALALSHRVLPESLHAASVDPKHGLGDAGIELVARTSAWSSRGGPLRAGINGFGFGGTNAHVILEEPPPAARLPPRARAVPPLLVSAHTDGALRAYARALAAWIDAHPEADAAAIAASVGASRDARAHRIAVIGAQHLAQRLRAWAEGGAPEGVLHGVVETAREGVEASGPLGAAQRFVAGLEVDVLAWSEGCEPLALPTYPFEHRAFWVDEAGAEARADHAMITRTLEASIDRFVCLARLSPDDPVVQEHVVQGAHVLPGAAAIELLRAAAATALGREPGALCEVTFARPIVVERERTLRIVVERGRGAALEARIEDDDGAVYARAEVWRRAPNGSAEVRSGTTETVRFDVEALYAALGSRGMAHGESFRGLTEVWVGAREVRGRVVVPEAARGRAFGIHPALLDAAMQPVAALLLTHAPEGEGLFVPFHVEAVELFGPVAGACESRITVGDDPAALSDAVRCDVEVSDDAGALALRLRGLSLRRMGATAVESGPADVASFFHAPQWEPDPIDAERISGGWVITPADHPLAVRLAERVERHGAEAERVPPQEIAEALRRRRRTGIAFLGPTERASSEASEPPGVLALLGVARALDGLEPDARPPRLLVVTSGATDGSEPLHAPIAGLGAALSDELRGVAARVLDVSLDEPTDAVTEMVARELGAPAGAAVVRVREGVRARRTVVSLAARDGAPIAIRDDGAYLVIGGTSGIGAALAQAFAAPGRTIVVISRTPPGASAARDAVVSALRATGATVEHLACDVTSSEDVARLIARVVRTHGAIRGVVHGAGIAEPRRISARDDETARRVMAPKVRGTLVLARELERQGQHPDFVALLSSISAVWPGLGGALSDYAAANAFLDAFASARRAAGSPFISIAWSAWSETGMGAEPALLSAMEARGLPGIGTRAGVEAFFRALALDRAHVIVAPQRTPRPAAIVARAPSAGAGPLASEIRALVARALVVPEEQVRTDASFLAMGLDSLTALELVKVLEERHDVTLPSTLFFELQTVDALADHLARTIRQPRARLEKNASKPREAAPLTPTQSAFYLNARLYPDVAAYSFSRQTVRGPLDLAALRAATAAVIRRHPMLRASIDGTDARAPVQRIVAACEPVVIDHGVTGDIEALAEKAANALFDLSKPPLLRVHVARDAGGRFDHVMLCAHHAVADAWSLHVIALDLWRAYARPDRFDDAPLAPCFLDVARPDPGGVDAALGWWRGKLASLPELRLPVDGDPTALPSPPLSSLAVRLDRARTSEVTDAAAASGVSLFHLTLAAHARCLARWCSARDVVINVARARRELRAPGIADAVGCFADTLPLRLFVDPSEPLSTTAARARDAMLELEQHAAPTSGDIARIVRESGRGPRVASPASYSFARFPLATPDEAPRVMSVTGRTASAATQLGLAAWEVGGELSFSFNYPSSLFRRSTIDGLARELLSELDAARRPREDCPRSLGERLWDALLEAGPRTVLRDGSREVSGDALRAAAAGVSRALRDRGVRRGDVVGLVAEQGLDGIAGMIGVLFSGAAFLPIDPAYPPRRAIDQLERGGARICLHASGTDPQWSSMSLADAIGGAPIEGPEPIDDDSLAYVMFTSGSTGRPKGVPITNRAIRGYLDWVLATFAYRPGDVCLGTASLSFDASVRQVLAPILAGATLIACPRALARDPDALLDAVRDEGVTVLSTVPSLLAQLVRRDLAPLSALSWLKVGGEPLPPGLVRALFDRLDRTPPIVNLYGPTEATINATYHVVHERPADDAARIPIGRAAAGARLEVSGSGDEGELLVGGPGVFAGYAGEPDGSARVFVERPDGGRLYRTGDRVRVRPDGLLEHLGRIDDQVKIHGQRIEPGEVEAVLTEHPEVALAVVRAIGEEPLRALEAWIVAHAGVAEDALRTWCEERLPDAMRPKRYHFTDSFPTTAADKVDRAALVPPSGPAPDATVEVVRLAFAEVLRVDEVGPDEDFFRLGGDSMGVLEVFARLEKALPSVPRAATLYRARTARALARAIEADGGDHDDATPAVDAEEPWFPLSPAQRGFLLARAIDPQSSVQWTARLSIEGPLDFARLRDAARLVFLRHPMLRVVVDPERRAQRVVDLDDPPLSIETTPDDASVERVVRDARQLRLDASVAPPIRMWLCRRTATDHVLVVAADHVIGDALSGWILAGELLDAYDALCREEVPTLAPLRSTFREWVTRPRDRADEALRVAAWRRIFEVPYVPPDGLDRDVRSVTVTLPEDRVDALRTAAARAEGTLYELVLAAYVHALRELTRRDDLVIGTALSGREDGAVDLARVIGPFATALPVRVRTAGRAPRATLDATRRAFAEARAHAMSAGEIARALPSGMPVEVASGLQLFFTFMDFEAVHTLRSETLRVRWVESEGDLPDGVDVHLSARRLEGTLRLVLHGAIDGEALEALRDRLLDVLEGYAAAPATSATLGVCFGDVKESAADTALIGYLPAPSAMAAAAGLQDGDAMRETLRAQLFPDGRPRWLERIDTPLGSSALLCLPVFADEIVPARAEAIVDAVAAAVSLAGEAGIGSASLAGMLPSHTGYGHAVVARLNGGPHAELTTGHATTVVAVVRTVLLACEAARVDLAAATVAFVGVGSIGGASAELLLSLGTHPRRIVLCDLARAGGRMRDVAETLRERGYAGRIELAESGAALPDAVYRAQVIVGAASTPGILDVARLAPGTVVVDDSFPHLFDPTRARARMRSRGDVLVVGGGLLDPGPIRRTLDVPAALAPFRAAIARAIPRRAVASCQLEPLLRRSCPELPSTLGLVTTDAARLCWDAADRLGVRAAKLHLGSDPISDAVLAAIASPWSRGVPRP